MVMVGYAEDHHVGCYTMYNPNKNSVVISRDTQWAKWTRSDPIATLKAMENDEFEEDVRRNNNVIRPNTRSPSAKQPEMLEAEGVLKVRRLKE
jgi:hypothetical protein